MDGEAVAKGEEKEEPQGKLAEPISTGHVVGINFPEHVEVIFQFVWKESRYRVVLEVS